MAGIEFFSSSLESVQTLDSPMTLTGSCTQIRGQGVHRSIIELTHPDACILIDQSEHRPGQLEVTLQDFQIRYADGVVPRQPAIRIVGPGTENASMGNQLVSRVQFGSPDKRSAAQGNPARYHAPPAWLALAGTVGLDVVKCGFAGYNEHAADAVRIEDVGEVQDVDGSLIQGKTLKTRITDCQGGPGLRRFVHAAPGSWVEGLQVDHCEAIACGEAVVVAGSPNAPGHGTRVEVAENHFNFRENGIVVSQGAPLIHHNHMQPHAFGVFEGWKGHVVLGDEALNGQRWLNFSKVHDNHMGVVDPNNVPYGVIVRENATRIIVRDNFMQKTRSAFVNFSTYPNVFFIQELGSD